LFTDQASCKNAAFLTKNKHPARPNVSLNEKDTPVKLFNYINLGIGELIFIRTPKGN